MASSVFWSWAWNFCGGPLVTVNTGSLVERKVARGAFVVIYSQEPVNCQ
jgi:hypothetical protein